MDKTGLWKDKDKGQILRILADIRQARGGDSDCQVHNEGQGTLSAKEAIIYFKTVKEFLSKNENEGQEKSLQK
ncbi:unnamed protein product, partial [Larinioides sclopetarius]